MITNTTTTYVVRKVDGLQLWNHIQEGSSEYRGKCSLKSFEYEVNYTYTFSYINRAYGSSARMLEIRFRVSEINLRGWEWTRAELIHMEGRGIEEES